MILKRVKGRRYGEKVFCKCDVCGKEFMRSYANLKKNQFCSMKCYWTWLKETQKGHKVLNETKRKIGKANSGKNNGSWKDGRIYTDKGYVLIYSPKHPNKVKGNYVLEHRLIVEKVLGRYLTGDEIVHHKNGIRDDNRPENLEVLSFGEHIKKRQEKMKELKCLKNGLQMST